MIYLNEQGRRTVLFKYIRCELQCVPVKVQISEIVADSLFSPK